MAEDSTAYRTILALIRQGCSKPHLVLLVQQVERRTVGNARHHVHDTKLFLEFFVTTLGAILLDYAERNDECIRRSSASSPGQSTDATRSGRITFLGTVAPIDLRDMRLCFRRGLNCANAHGICITFRAVKDATASSSSPLDYRHVFTTVPHPQSCPHPKDDTWNGASAYRPSYPRVRLSHYY